MKIFRSLHAKILLGYSVVGGLFILLVANALVEFRSVEGELAKQQEVVVFYDAVRHARRLEKNFLLYLRISDLKEALEKIDTAIASLDNIRSSGRWVQVADSDLQEVRRYRDALNALFDTSAEKPASPEQLNQVYLAGLGVIKLGEKLDGTAKSQVAAVLSQHDARLLQTIGAALALALIAGILVTRSVVRPLRDIESSLQRIAKGETERLDGREAGSEVESLTRSINDTIHEIEVRQENQARSSRLMALGTMLSGVAHELNNPLSNISSSCQILQEDWGELPDAQARQLLGQIDHQVLRAQRIVSDLLDFSRNRDLVRRSENIRSLVDEAIHHARNQIPDTVTIHLDIDGDICMNVDRMRFQQVLVNILKNAVEATGGHGTIQIRGWREELPEGRGATLEIEDDGHGIPADCLSRVFDPFFTTKPVGKGTGLGLAVVHEIVTQHGGTIAVDSGSAGGARFWIHIPDQSVEAQES
ncbi:MAG TPA: HAMP domain-containing sensor histidine kinase [Rhodocyclaceae bacterium]|nr:HAMP domain-containing sensor histidine kinase [Rhodocyclaceae bacterium]